MQIIGARDPAGLDKKPANATRRMSAHALVQEFLNLHEQLYGLVTDGHVLRLLRDSSRLVKQSYLEFDLDRIFTDGLFADFAVLYRLLHATRLPLTNDTAAQSLIERYHQDSLDSGARIREGLSKAVEQAILDFGNGFLSHPGNDALRAAATAGDLQANDYYQQLLRLIYRLLFLMVIEERDLVFPPDAPKSKRDIHHKFYSVSRLRRLSEKRYLADPRRHDLWLALQACFRLFEADGPGARLGIAPLAGDLFSPRSHGPRSPAVPSATTCSSDACAPSVSTGIRTAASLSASTTPPSMSRSSARSMRACSSTNRSSPARAAELAVRIPAGRSARCHRLPTTPPTTSCSR